MWLAVLLSSPRVLSRFVLNIFAAYSSFDLIFTHFLTTLNAPLQILKNARGYFFEALEAAVLQMTKILHTRMMKCK